MPLQENDLAPEIALSDQDGKSVRLSDHRGRWVLVYFYPKDDTPGCTVEACGLRDNMSALNALKLDVFGISPDSVASHRNFAVKFKLDFLLLADENKEVVKAYGVWALKRFMGREYMGVERTSFLIDPDGRIVKIYRKVKPEAHSAEVLAELSFRDDTNKEVLYG